VIAELKRLIQGELAPDVLAREIGKLLAGCPGVIASALLNFDEAGNVHGTLPLVCRREFNHLAPGWETPIWRVAQRVQSERDFCSERIQQGASEVAVLGSPVLHKRDVSSVICLIVPADQQALPLFEKVLLVISHQLAQRVGGTEVTETPPTPSVAIADKPVTTASAASVPTLQSATMNPESGAPALPMLAPSGALRVGSVWQEILFSAVEHARADQAYQAIANELARCVGAQRLFLGLHRGTRRHCRLQSISGDTDFDHRTALTTDCEEAMAEAIVRGELAYVQAEEPSADATSAVSNMLRTCVVDDLASGPLFDHQQRAIGAWVAVGMGRIPAGSPQAVDLMSQWTEHARNAGRCLEIIQRSRPGWRKRLLNKFWHEDRRNRTMMMLTLCAAMCGVMFVPYPYHIKCECEVQAVTRRFVPVPYDGVLKSVSVEPGDVVQAGEVLAQMDDREIDWELAAKQAEYQRARKQHDMSLAGALTADAQIAKLEMERLDVQIQLLLERRQNLEIKSPIDGVIISGDPSKREGARLKQGETLFEAGPLDRMLVEIYVPDAEVSHVERDQHARIRLDAFPSRAFDAQLVRVSPRAVAREQANVFIAEVELENPKHLLRPGMSGRGRIETPRQSLGWVLFHKAWRAVLQRFS
jgi:RND family efflux transporter MFP subunit